MTELRQAISHAISQCSHAGMRRRVICRPCLEAFALTALAQAEREKDMLKTLLSEARAEVERLTKIIEQRGHQFQAAIDREQATLARVRADHKMLLDSFTYHGYIGEMGKTYQVTLSEEVWSRYRAALEGR